MQILAIDFGLKKVGLAIGNTVTKTSMPISTIFYKSKQELFNLLEKHVIEWKPEFIIIGNPLNMDQTESEMSKLAEKFSTQFSKKFNLEYILKYFQNKHKNIKNFLLDQKFVSGLGNIYASEVLFESKIYPLKSASLLTNDQLKKIIKYSKKVLKRSIAKGGSSIRDFKNTTGDQGSFQKEFKVYNREHLKCMRRSCGGIIKKIVISNRSSFFCNICQK